MSYWIFPIRRYPGGGTRNKRTEEGEKQRLRYFQQAVEMDPGYALAYSGIADSYVVLAEHGRAPIHEAFSKARVAAEKAVERDDSLAEAHVSLGSVKTRKPPS